MSDARRRFYKAFYVTLIPAILAAAGLWLLPIPVSLPIRLALLVAVPIITTCLFWSKLGEMELNQVMVTRKDGVD
jgi:hypothetical protein